MYLIKHNSRSFCLLKLTKNRTCISINSNICHVWTECLSHNLNTNWVLAGGQVHISEMVYLKNILRICFLPFPNIYANLGMGKFKNREEREREGALTKRRIEDTGEKIALLLSQHEALHI